MAAMVDLTIAGRTYQVACREGEEDNLRAAARLVDGKSREALAGLGTLSRSAPVPVRVAAARRPADRQKPDAAGAPSAPPVPTPRLVGRAEALADRLEVACGRT